MRSSTFLTKLRNYLRDILEKLKVLRFKVKRSILGLSKPQLLAFKDKLPFKDFWDGKSFPDLSNQGISTGSQKPKLFTYFFSNYLTNLDWFKVPTKSTLVSLPRLIWTKVIDFVLETLYIARRDFWTDGVQYLQLVFGACLIEAMLTDDEPLWEPVEWSLVQVWIMFFFAFAWIAENLITSRFGSYTGRDKRVWAAWYKTFWLIEAWYLLSLAGAALLVITPFYHEINYTLPLVISWWTWYTRVFFFKFISILSLALYLAHYLQANIGVFHWRTSLFIILLVNLFLCYLLYMHFLMAFFAYFTDPNWYHRTRLTDYVHLSHEPNKWSWGNAKRDHFSYHKSPTVFWLKNDGPFASAFLFFHMIFFVFLFSLNIYWVALCRRVYSTQEVSFTYTTYCVAAIRQFFYFFLLLYLLVIFSFCVQYWRLPVEYAWVANSQPITTTFLNVLLDYPEFLLGIFLG